ncbi:MAG: hypothetical protein PVG22_18750, partial [Chromatiales bacterium]
MTLSNANVLREAEKANLVEAKHTQAGLRTLQGEIDIESSTPESPDLDRHIDAACARIAPLWPL